MCDAVIPLGAALLGGLLAIGGGFCAQWWRYRLMRRTVGGSIRGEIGAIIDIIERRRYVETLEDVISKFKGGQTLQLVYPALKYNYFVTHEALAPKMGVLKSGDAERVARFYIMAKALLEGFTTEHLGSLPPEHLLALLEENLGILKDLIALGNQLLTTLK